MRFGDDQKIRLTDGRDLSFLTGGDLEGIPVFFFHGAPGSRFVFSDQDISELPPRVFWIFPERPGYGLSTPQPHRALTGWPTDVIELADQLGIERFAVAGHSGGGPHALVCAWKYPSRVFSAFLFASPAPVESIRATKGMVFGNRINFFLGSRMQWLVRYLMRSAAKTMLNNPEKFLDAVTRQMCPSDRVIMENVMKNENQREFLIKGIKEAYRQGSEAQFIDGQVMMSTRPWGFALSEIKVPVHVWHGEEDTLVTASMASRFREIPNANVRMIPNAGHLVMDVPSVAEEFRHALLAEWQNIRR